MATGTRDQGKTTFIMEFLGENPHGNVQAVNEAWTKSGKDGSIGSTLIQKLRSRMGLTGNLRATSKPATATREKLAAKKPKTETATPGKTKFVKDFLNANPQGTTKDVNEAWRAGGFEGTISPTLVNKTRLKLTGKRRRKARTAAKAKLMTITATPGKTSFLKEFLLDHPEGNVRAVNEAWKAAGFDGTISTALVYQARVSLGLAGNLRGKSKKSEAKSTSTSKKLGRPRKETTAAVDGQSRGQEEQPFSGPE